MIFKWFSTVYQVEPSDDQPWVILENELDYSTGRMVSTIASHHTEEADANCMRDNLMENQG